MDSPSAIIQVAIRFCIGVLVLWALTFTVKTERTTIGQSFLTNIFLWIPSILLAWFSMHVLGVSEIYFSVRVFSQTGIVFMGLFALYLIFSFGLIQWMYRLSVPETVWIFLALSAAQLMIGKMAEVFSYVQQYHINHPIL